MVNHISINFLTLPLQVGQQSPSPGSSTNNPSDVSPLPGEVFVPNQNPTSNTTNSTTNTSRFIDAPTTAFIQQRLESIIQGLRVNGQSLRLHPSGRYFILQNANDNTAERYYPQFNATFFVEGRTDNGDPVRPATIQSVNENGTEILVPNSTATPHTYSRLISAMGLTIAHNPNSTPPNNRIVFNNNWTFTSPANPGITFHLQADGSIWGSRDGNTGTTYSLNHDGSLRQTSGSQPLPTTRFFSQHGICPLRISANDPSRRYHAGAFRRPDCMESFLLQSDGSIFYTGRLQTNDNPTEPVTHEFNSSTNTWSPNTARREPLPSTITLARLNALRRPDGTWSLPNDPNPQYGPITVTPDGRRIIRTTPGHSEVYQYINNQWTLIGRRNGSIFGDSQIETAIQTILNTSNSLGNLSSTTLSFLSDLNATQRPDGTYIYRGSNTASQGDPIYILSDGRLLMRSSTPNSNTFYIYGTRTDGTRGWINYEYDSSNFLRNFRHELREEIRTGMQTIQNARNRNLSPSTSTFLSNLNAARLEDGTYIYRGQHAPSYGDSIHILGDGRLLMLRPDSDTRFQIYGANGWSDVYENTSALPENIRTEVQTGIQAILNSRFRLPPFRESSSRWISPPITGTSNGDGTYRYESSNHPRSTGDSFVILSCGRVIMLDPTNSTVWLHDGSSDWINIGRTRNGPDCFDFNSNIPCVVNPHEVAAAIRLIRVSRANRNWRP